MSPRTARTTADKGGNRVNLTATVRPEIKEQAIAVAENENNSVSRIVENALVEYFARHPLFAEDGG